LQNFQIQDIAAIGFIDEYLLASIQFIRERESIAANAKYVKDFLPKWG